MTWGEAVRLTSVLLVDPTSQVAAARNDWTAPRSPEWFVLADLFDLTHRSLAKNPKPYPRPQPEHRPTRRGGTNLSRSQVLAVLNAHGHDFEEARHG